MSLTKIGLLCVEEEEVSQRLAVRVMEIEVMSQGDVLGRTMKVFT